MAAGWHQVGIWAFTKPKWSSYPREELPADPLSFRSAVIKAVKSSGSRRWSVRTQCLYVVCDWQICRRSQHLSPKPNLGEKHKAVKSLEWILHIHLWAHCVTIQENGDKANFRRSTYLQRNIRVILTVIQRRAGISCYISAAIFKVLGIGRIMPGIHPLKKSCRCFESQRKIRPSQAHAVGQGREAKHWCCEGFCFQAADLWLICRL